MLVSYVTVIASFTAVPIMVLNICALGIARLRKSINYGAFAVAGAIVGAIVTVPISVAFNMVAFLPLTIVYPMAMGALSAIVYRSLAGLEPVPLPEHVLVDHDSSLAPPDDPSRRMHRVLFQK